MPQGMQNLISEAKKNRFSTIPHLSEEDIIGVWDSVAEFIEIQMLNRKGVHIANLGTFSFVHKRMDIGNNKFILLQRPVFVLSEKFAQTHALQYTKYHTAGEIPVIHLNFTVLSMDSPFERDVVESCVREILQALSRAVASQKNIELLFRGIGVLSIRDPKTKMKFFKDFLNTMDGSGNLVRVLANELFTGSCSSSVAEIVRKCMKRPATAESIVLTQTPVDPKERSATPTLMLPRLNGKTDLLSPIAENDKEEKRPLEEEKFPLPPSRAGSRDVMRQHPIIGVSLTADELHEATPARDGLRGSAVKKLPSPPHTPMRPRTEPAAPTPAPPPSRQKSEAKPEIVEPQEQKRAESAPVPVAESRSIRLHHLSLPTTPNAACVSSNHRSKAGQEICYLCMQRSARNIPVSFDEERQRREKEHDALLMQYQQMKENQVILAEQDALKAASQVTKKVAAFNLGVTESMWETKGKRSPDLTSSYLFQNRALTPLRFRKQEEYCKALDEQVELKKTREKQELQDRELLERLEQLQMMEELSSQREAFLKNRTQQIAQYEQELTTQIKMKKRYSDAIQAKRRLSVPRPQTLNPFTAEPQRNNKGNKVRDKSITLPRTEPVSKDLVFGKYDSNNEKLLEQKERARALYKNQLEVIADKKKRSLLQQLTRQKEEMEVLRSTRQELIQDRQDAHSLAFHMRHSLEDDWKEQTRGKHARDAEERKLLRIPGMLLHQQTEDYKRCGNCQRRPSNRGKSNIWKDSRYIPGSRLMV